MGHGGASQTIASESGRRSWPAPAPKAIAHPLLWPFSTGRTWRPGLRAVIFGRGCARGLFLAHGGASQSLTPFRVGGRSWPAPPPKAIAHPFLWPFSAERTWCPGLRAVIFGRGFVRGLCLAHGGPSQSLAAFRVRRTKLASPTPQGYSPPVFVAFVRWTNLAPRPSGGYFWARLRPRLIFGTPRPLAKSRPIPSPADELRPRPPPRL